MPDTSSNNKRIAKNTMSFRKRVECCEKIDNVNMSKKIEVIYVDINIKS